MLSPTSGSITERSPSASARRGGASSGAAGSAGASAGSSGGAPGRRDRRNEAADIGAQAARVTRTRHVTGPRSR